MNGRRSIVGRNEPTSYVEKIREEEKKNYSELFYKRATERLMVLEHME